MLKYENLCCDCATPNYPCRGSRCPLRNVPVVYCDRCDPDGDAPLRRAYTYNGLQLCQECYDELNKIKEN